MPTQATRAQTSGPQTQRKRPGDLTGVNSQKLAAERDANEEAERAAQVAAKQEDRAVKINTVVDLTEDGRAQREEVEEIAVAAEPHPETMIIRVNYPIENMTYGKQVLKDAEFDEEGRMTVPPVLGNLIRYDFEEGQQYRVPWEVGMHLKGLGYVYEF